ncbi:hypothetical protein NDU88_006271 [Pleurodeles waltl]|uniref:Uncharacterized protein n=1 Tax=Pleurodeles waltl TaxID=8319 RepID=A0AAV7RPM4_PLEWA|nr:hypothetical protein NDU88_006271 [Pleurodeles waltl]
MDFRLQHKKKEQKKWPVVVTALLTPVAAIVLTTILIVYKDDIHIPWLDQEHYIPKSGQGERATGGENNNISKQHERVEDKTKWVKYTKWKEDGEDYKDNTFVQMVPQADIDADLHACDSDPLSPAHRKELESPNNMDEVQLPLRALPFGKAPGPDGLPVPQADIDADLHACDWNPLSPAHRKELESPNNMDKVHLPLRALLFGKAPGPDGLPVSFYLLFLPELVNHLLNLCNSFNDVTGLTPTMTRAELSLIPKPGEYRARCSSYHPFALPNTDAQIFTKLLSSTLD